MVNVNPSNDGHRLENRAQVPIFRVNRRGQQLTPAGLGSVLSMAKALVLVDLQNDYFFGGRMELHNAEQAGERARQLLAHFRATNQLVVHVQHVATESDATFFLPESDGVKIREMLLPIPGEEVVTKHFPNAFLQTGLQRYLEQLEVKELVVAGMMTHMCIDSTVRAACDAGFSCEVAGDACATRTQTYGGLTVGADDVHTAFLAALSGTFAEVTTVAELLARR
jgi:nicotinamidase-related amidase